MKKKIKGKKIFKNGATGGYIYDVKRKNGYGGYYGPQKGYGKTPSSRSKKSSRSLSRKSSRSLTCKSFRSLSDKYGEVSKKRKDHIR